MATLGAAPVRRRATRERSRTTVAQGIVAEAVDVARRFGVRPHRIIRETDSRADAIVELAAEVDADLVVMGCYGHSRLREQMFGGVTRAFLARPPAPILMTH